MAAFQDRGIIWSDIDGNVPTPDEMSKDGRIGINQRNGKLFTRKVDGTVRTTPLDVNVPNGLLQLDSSGAISMSVLSVPWTATTARVSPSGDGANYTFQNGTKTAWDIYGGIAPPGWYKWGNVRSTINPKPGDAVQNYSSYNAFIYNEAVWDYSGATTPAGVGLEVFAVNKTAGAASFGLGLGFTDSYDGTAPHSVASTMVGGEIDLETYNAGSAATGFSFVIQGAAQAGANVFEILANPASTARWANGLSISNGAMKAGSAGVILGCEQSASGANLPSTPIVFKVFDGVSAEHNIYMQGLSTGGAGAYVGLNAPFSAEGAVTANRATAIPAGGANTVGIKATSAANFGVFFGSGAPTLSAAKGSLYLRSDGSSASTRAYINTDGSTTWTALTTAA